MGLTSSSSSTEVSDYISSIGNDYQNFQEKIISNNINGNSLLSLQDEDSFNNFLTTSIGISEFTLRKVLYVHFKKNKAVGSDFHIGEEQNHVEANSEVESIHIDDDRINDKVESSRMTTAPVLNENILRELKEIHDDHINDKVESSTRMTTAPVLNENVLRKLKEIHADDDHINDKVESSTRMTTAPVLNENVLRKLRENIANRQFMYNRTPIKESSDRGKPENVIALAKGPSKAVYQIDATTGEILYIHKSMTDATRLLKVSENDRHTIRKCCQNKTEKYKGFLWDYAPLHNFDDGSYYVGEMENGKRHGIGIYTPIEGLEEIGKWQSDKLIGASIRDSQLTKDRTIIKESNDRASKNQNKASSKEAPDRDKPESSPANSGSFKGPSKAVYQIDATTGEILYIHKSMTDATRLLKVSESDRRTISKCCQNKTEKYKGFLWDYAPLHNFDDGSYYVGEMENGKRHGIGIYTPIEGLEEIGKWRNDVCIPGKVLSKKAVIQIHDDHINDKVGLSSTAILQRNTSHQAVAVHSSLTDAAIAFCGNELVKSKIKEACDSHSKFDGFFWEYTKSHKFDDASYYIGEMDEQMKKQGYGKLFLNDGRTYEGFFLNDNRNGKGTEITKEGSCKYVGMWKDNQKDGFGWMDAYGDFYVGTWRSNIFDYQVPVIQMNLDGKEINAFQTAVDAAEMVYNGKDDSYQIWLCCNGEKQEHGNFRWKKTNSKNKNGVLFIGDQNGFGKMIHEHYMYIGDFVEGKMQGVGLYKLNECSFKGNFKWEEDRDGTILPSGHCYVFISPDGDRYEGHILKGKYDGFGKLTKADGTVQEGLFCNDEFIKDKKGIIKNKSIIVSQEHNVVPQQSSIPTRKRSDVSNSDVSNNDNIHKGKASANTDNSINEKKLKTEWLRNTITKILMDGEMKSRDLGLFLAKERYPLDNKLDGHTLMKEIYEKLNLCLKSDSDLFEHYKNSDGDFVARLKSKSSSHGGDIGGHDNKGGRERSVDDDRRSSYRRDRDRDIRKRSRSRSRSVDDNGGRGSYKRDRDRDIRKRSRSRSRIVDDDRRGSYKKDRDRDIRKRSRSRSRSVDDDRRGSYKRDRDIRKRSRSRSRSRSVDGDRRGSYKRDRDRDRDIRKQRSRSRSVDDDGRGSYKRDRDRDIRKRSRSRSRSRSVDRRGSYKRDRDRDIRKQRSRSRSRSVDDDRRGSYKRDRDRDIRKRSCSRSHSVDKDCHLNRSLEGNNNERNYQLTLNRDDFGNDKTSINVTSLNKSEKSRYEKVSSSPDKSNESMHDASQIKPAAKSHEPLSSISQERLLSTDGSDTFTIKKDSSEFTCSGTIVGSWSNPTDHEAGLLNGVFENVLKVKGKIQVDELCNYVEQIRRAKKYTIEFLKMYAQQNAKEFVEFSRMSKACVCTTKSLEEGKTDKIYLIPKNLRKDFPFLCHFDKSEDEGNELIFYGIAVIRDVDTRGIESLPTDIEKASKVRFDDASAIAKELSIDFQNEIPTTSVSPETIEQDLEIGEIFENKEIHHNKKIRACLFFKKGYCKFGDDCRDSHQQEDAFKALIPNVIVDPASNTDLIHNAKESKEWLINVLKEFLSSSDTPEVNCSEISLHFRSVSFPFAENLTGLNILRSEFGKASICIKSRPDLFTCRYTNDSKLLVSMVPSNTSKSKPDNIRTLKEKGMNHFCSSHGYSFTHDSENCKYPSKFHNKADTPSMWTCKLKLEKLLEKKERRKQNINEVYFFCSTHGLNKSHDSLICKRPAANHNIHDSLESRSRMDIPQGMMY